MRPRSAPARPLAIHRAARRAVSLAAVALAAGACAPSGEGRVDARFDLPECPPGTTLDALRDYGWDAGFLATERFYEILIVQLYRFRVDVFETDGLGIRVDLEGLERAGLLAREGEFFTPAAPPLIVPVGEGRTEVQIVLSLFGTCERFPGYSAVEGEVTFDRFRVRIDGSETGSGEVLTGRVETATLSYPRAPGPIGVVEATFDFEPPERPLREFE